MNRKLNGILIFFVSCLIQLVPVVSASAQDLANFGHLPPSASEISKNITAGARLEISARDKERARVLARSFEADSQYVAYAMKLEGGKYVANVPVDITDHYGSWSLTYYFQIQTKKGQLLESEQFDIASVRDPGLKPLSQACDQLEQHVIRLRELSRKLRSGDKLASLDETKLSGQLSRIRLGMLEYLRWLQK